MEEGTATLHLSAHQSECIMQLDVTTDSGLVSILNVYRPVDYQDSDSLDEFGMCIGQIATALFLTTKWGDS